MSRYQKDKTNLDFTEARDSEWQWHQLGHTQVCTLLQTDNHTSIPPLSSLTGRVPFLQPNQQRQTTEGKVNIPNLKWNGTNRTCDNATANTTPTIKYYVKPTIHKSRHFCGSLSAACPWITTDVTLWSTIYSQTEHHLHLRHHIQNINNVPWQVQAHWRFLRMFFVTNHTPNATLTLSQHWRNKPLTAAVAMYLFF